MRAAQQSSLISGFVSRASQSFALAATIMEVVNLFLVFGKSSPNGPCPPSTIVGGGVCVCVIACLCD